jgi:hypothetical protein
VTETVSFGPGRAWFRAILAMYIVFASMYIDHIAATKESDSEQSFVRQWRNWHEGALFEIDGYRHIALPWFRWPPHAAAGGEYSFDLGIMRILIWAARPTCAGFLENMPHRLCDQIRFPDVVSLPSPSNRQQTSAPYRSRSIQAKICSTT